MSGKHLSSRAMRMGNKRILLAALSASAAVFGWSHSTARANVLVDGDFESGLTTTTAASTTVGIFPGWSVGGNTTGNGLTTATSPISGSYSAKFTMNNSSALESIYQDFTLGTASFNVSLSAVGEDPSSGGRTAAVLLGDSHGDVNTDGSTVINFRVVPSANSSPTTGDVQIYENGSFTTVMSNAFTFATSSNYDTASQPVNLIDFAGTMINGSLSYTITIDGVTSPVITGYQTEPSAFLSNIGLSGVNGGTANGPFIIDNVSVTPEPASMGLLALGSLGLLRRRKRSAESA